MAYTARVLAICDNAQTIFKDRGGGEFEDATIVTYMNAALLELENRGAFATLGYFDMTLDDVDYDLVTEFSDLVTPLSLGWKSSSATRYTLLTPLRTMSEYLQCKGWEDQYDPDVLATSYTSPTYCLFNRGYAYVWPAPTETVTDGFELYYTSSATRITDSVDPPTPASFDMMYVFFALHMAYLGDRPNRESPQLSQAYYEKFLKELNRYMRSVQPRGGLIRPDR